MKRKWYLFLALPLLLAVLTVRAFAATPLQDFEYRIEKDAIVLEKYTGSSTAVTVPAQMEIRGEQYPVVLQSKTLFRGNKTITSVKLEAVSFLDGSMEELFRDCTALTRVTFSGLDTSAVTDMDQMFSGCAALTEIIGMENWNTSRLESMYLMFNGTGKLSRIDLSRWDLSGVKNTGWCFQHCGASEILLPENLAVISAGFLNHATNYAGSSFTVPAGVKQIGYAHTFYDFGTYSMAEIKVAEGNAHYKAVDGILYSADGSQLLAVPRVKKFENGVYEIPEGVTFLGELSFSRNYNIKKLVLPNSLELYHVPLYDPAYILYEDTGNLNAGLNLNIAIYCYTGIIAYEVKADNPRYSSENGIIYNKDRTAVVAVPTRYQQKILIPEGVTAWESGAMWCAGDTVLGLMDKCSGVEIPASLTDIAPDQLEKINQLARKFSRFTVTVHPDNPAYYTENGLLLARPRAENWQAALEESEFVYDGSGHCPRVSVFSGGEELTENQDYTLQYLGGTDAGKARVVITGMGAYYGQISLEYTVKPAQPTFDAPGELQAVVGQSLSELALPEGYSWSAEHIFTQPGSYQFPATYDPGDPNYAPVSGVTVGIQVSNAPLTARQIGQWCIPLASAVLLACLLLRSKKKKSK